jgi:hypothetical protein
VTEPTHLNCEQVLPIAVALQRREVYRRAGAGILIPPLPNCPTCELPPEELFTRSEHIDFFLHDRIGLGFRPCGHNFTADAEDVFNANEAARYTIAAEETP